MSFVLTQNALDFLTDYGLDQTQIDAIKNAASRSILFTSLLNRAGIDPDLRLVKTISTNDMRYLSSQHVIEFVGDPISLSEYDSFAIKFSHELGHALMPNGSSRNDVFASDPDYQWYNMSPSQYADRAGLYEATGNMTGYLVAKQMLLNQLPGDVSELYVNGQFSSGYLWNNIETNLQIFNSAYQNISSLDLNSPELQSFYSENSPAMNFIQKFNLDHFAPSDASMSYREFQAALQVINLAYYKLPEDQRFDINNIDWDSTIINKDLKGFNPDSGSYSFSFVMKDGSTKWANFKLDAGKVTSAISSKVDDSGEVDNIVITGWRNSTDPDQSGADEGVLNVTVGG